MNIEGGWSYPKALEVIKDLKANGFDAGVTVGGIWVDAPEGDKKVIEIARKHGGGSSCGQTTLQWMTFNTKKREQ